MLTSDILLCPQLEHHHLQTLPDTPQKQGIKDEVVAHISREFWLQVSASTRLYNMVDEHMPMAWWEHYFAT
jgi:ABC-type microcin C transport system permease subunit YejB